MKKYLLLAAALFVGTICFTSCSDDDEEVDYDQLFSDFAEGKIKPTASFEEKDNTMSLTLKYKGVVTTRDVATFDGDRECESFKTFFEFVSKELADRMWAEVAETRLKIETPFTRLDDKTIVRDMYLVYHDQNYNQIKNVMANKMIDAILDKEERAMIDDYTSGKKLPETDLTEKGNTMTLTINYKGFMKITYLFTFDSYDTCNSFTTTYVFSNKLVAEYFWLSNSSGPRAKYSTRKDDYTIVEDLTVRFEGRPRDEMKDLAESKKQDADQGKFPM